VSPDFWILPATHKTIGGGYARTVSCPIVCRRGMGAARHDPIAGLDCAAKQRHQGGEARHVGRCQREPDETTSAVGLRLVVSGDDSVPGGQADGALIGQTFAFEGAQERDEAVVMLLFAGEKQCDCHDPTPPPDESVTPTDKQQIVCEEDRNCKEKPSAGVPTCWRPPNSFLVLFILHPSSFRLPPSAFVL